MQVALVYGCTQSSLKPCRRECKLLTCSRILGNFVGWKLWETGCTNGRYCLSHWLATAMCRSTAVTWWHSLQERKAVFKATWDTCEAMSMLNVWDLDVSQGHPPVETKGARPGMVRLGRKKCGTGETQHAGSHANISDAKSDLYIPI